MSLLNKYTKGFSDFPVLSEEEEFQLFLEYRRTKSTTVANKLITSNLRFVLHIIYKEFGSTFTNNSQLIPDAIQEGNLGLFDALEKFDPEKGIRFIAYAKFYVRGRIASSLKKNSRRKNFVKKDYHTLDAKKFPEFASASSIESIDNSLTTKKMRVLVKKHINNLPNHHKTFIESVFYKGETLAEIARRDKVSRQAIDTRKKLAFVALKNSMESYIDPIASWLVV